MATIFNILLVIFFLGFITQGNCQCPGVSSLTIVQTKTGKLVANKPEWKLTISNTCICSQLNVNLACNGFQSVETVDPSVLSKQGDLCLVNNGNPIAGKQQFSFTYASDQEFPFKAVQSQVGCS
ncbi:hypothetical protein Tsubulata_014357 [Turnera subulata]|uniref:Beta-1,3-N-Acetylglucosaminyltransferase family protein n=1 Tax=Turnera subulata TaxID=218843 RepID=A0A9Q0J1J4_9ROSI|nr:hypothetical protein Tsubulata_014357 [Turnera subulata]